MSNIEEDSLKRVNIIIEKTKAYDNCVFPIGTRGEFGTLYISDLKGLLSELETYKKIAEKLAEYIAEIDVSEAICENMEQCNEDCKQCALDLARNEVESN